MGTYFLGVTGSSSDSSTPSGGAGAAESSSEELTECQRDKNINHAKLTPSNPEQGS